MGDSERTLAEHLMTVADHSEAAAAQLYDGPRCPVGAAHVWEWWKQLHSRRSSAGFGANPIAYESMLAWERVANLLVDPVEWELINVIETEYLQHRARCARKKNKQDGSTPDDAEQELDLDADAEEAEPT